MIRSKAQARGAAIDPPTLALPCAQPLFETGDPRYAWLNGVQAIGVGGRERATVSYDIYALQ
jgi:Protein of unknown function (DUF3237)